MVFRYELKSLKDSAHTLSHACWHLTITFVVSSPDGLSLLSQKKKKKKKERKKDKKVAPGDC